MKRKIFASVIVPLTAFLVYTSCTKIDTTDLGNGLIPAVDNVNTFDTILEVSTDNKLFVDTTDMLYEDGHAIGIIENDAEFGKTTAALYSTFNPASYGSYPFLNRDAVKIDSIVLSLAYTSTYGDSTGIQEFEVREIKPSADFKDSVYPITNPDFDVLPTVLGKATVNFLRLKNDSVYYVNAKETVSTINELRIPLDTAFGRRFVNYDTSGAYQSDEKFKVLFKGLEVRANEGTSPTKKGFAYFNLTDNARSRITFYCRIERDGVKDTIAPVFTYTAGAEANIIRRAPANAYLANVTNTTENDEKLYIQSTPGSYATIKIPGLSGLSNRVIHRAELIAERAQGAEDNIYGPPSTLFIDAISTTGDSAFTIRNDFSLVNAAPGYDLTTIGGILKDNKYTFNISRYVQSIATRQFPNYTLRIYAPYIIRPYFMAPNTNQVSGKTQVVLNTPVASGRVILLGGGSAAPERMRLRIIYSKI